MIQIWPKLDSMPKQQRFLLLHMKSKFSSQAKKVLRSRLPKLNTLREIQIQDLLFNQINWIINASFHRRESTKIKFSKTFLNLKRVETWDQRHLILLRFNRISISLMQITIKILYISGLSNRILRRVQRIIISKKFGQERDLNLADQLVIQVRLNWTLQIRRSSTFRKSSCSQRSRNMNPVPSRWRPSRLSMLPQMRELDMNLLQTM